MNHLITLFSYIIKVRPFVFWVKLPVMWIKTELKKKKVFGRVLKKKKNLNPAELESRLPCSSVSTLWSADAQ